MYHMSLLNLLIEVVFLLRPSLKQLASFEKGDSKLSHAHCLHPSVYRIYSHFLKLLPFHNIFNQKNNIKQVKNE